MGAKPSFPIFLLCKKNLAKGGHGRFDQGVNTPLVPDETVLQCIEIAVPGNRWCPSVNNESRSLGATALGMVLRRV